MTTVVGITLRTAGKLYYFDPGTEKYLREERVLVETARGLELGIIKLPPHEVDDDQIVPPLKNILRRATAVDIHRDDLNRDRETHAMEVCKRLISKFNLPMRLIDAQYTFDNSHILIHFLAENRVDFRELVRELAHELHTRIELRQVGVRDEAKLLGGYGLCGRQLLLHDLFAEFCPGRHQPGERARSGAESTKNLRRVQPSDVLPHLRTRVLQSRWAGCPR